MDTDNCFTLSCTIRSARGLNLTYSCGRDLTHPEVFIDLDVETVYRDGVDDSLITLAYKNHKVGLELATYKYSLNDCYSKLQETHLILCEGLSTAPQSMIVGILDTLALLTVATVTPERD